jgi:hypothetical protein
VAKKKKGAFRYRDKKTGKFVSKAAWKRSRKGRKREKVEKRKPPKPPAIPPTPPLPPPPPPVFEWMVAFTYDRTGKTFDVIVTATDEGEAYNTALQFLRDDPKGQRILTPTRRLKRGWEGVPIRGRETGGPAGEAEYREESEEE